MCIHAFQKCLRKCLLEKQAKTSAFSVIQAEFERAKGDVDSKRIFLDQSFRDCVTSDWKLDMEMCSELVQLSIKGEFCVVPISILVHSRIGTEYKYGKYV